MSRNRTYLRVLLARAGGAAARGRARLKALLAPVVAAGRDRAWLKTLAALAAAAAVVAGIWGCPRRTPPAAELPVTRESVPILRVLIASAPNIRLATTGPYTLFADGSAVAASNDPLPPCPLSRAGDAWALGAGRYAGNRLTIKAGYAVTPDPAEPGRSPGAAVQVNGTAYRGQVTFHPTADGRILAVNYVDLETYLPGVLGRELYAGWLLTTFKAQAIAARTYALYERSTFGRDRLYDLRDDESSQVYGGVQAESEKAWMAARGTYGVVLAAGPKGKETIFRAHYSACCGGRTNSVHVLYGPAVSQGPLAGGAACEDCRKCKYYTWQAVAIPKPTVFQALVKVYPSVAGLGGLRTIQVAPADAGQPVWIDLVGLNNAKVRIRAYDLRLALIRHAPPAGPAIRSANCRILDDGANILFDEGRGFGHGVGLCQWGAQGKAEAGFSAEQILQAYYPGSTLFKAY